MRPDADTSDPCGYQRTWVRLIVPLPPGMVYSELKPDSLYLALPILQSLRCLLPYCKAALCSYTYLYALLHTYPLWLPLPAIYVPSTRLAVIGHLQHSRCLHARNTRSICGTHTRLQLDASHLFATGCNTHPNTIRSAFAQTSSFSHTPIYVHRCESDLLSVSGTQKPYQFETAWKTYVPTPIFSKLWGDLFAIFTSKNICDKV